MPGRNRQLDLPVEGLHFDLGAQRRLGKGNRDGVVEVGPFALETLVGFHGDHDVEVPGRAAGDSGLPLAVEPQPRPFVDTRRNGYRNGLFRLDPSGPATVRTAVPDHFSRAPAFVARPTDPEEALLENHLATSVTAGAGLGVGTGFGTAARAGRARAHLGDLDLGLAALDHIASSISRL